MGIYEIRDTGKSRFHFGWHAAPNALVAPQARREHWPEDRPDTGNGLAEVGLGTPFARILLIRDGGGKAALAEH